MKHFNFYGVILSMLLLAGPVSACDNLSCVITEGENQGKASKIEMTCAKNPEEALNLQYTASWSTENAQFSARLLSKHANFESGAPFRYQVLNLYVRPSGEEWNSLAFSGGNNLYPIPVPKPERSEVLVAAVNTSGKSFRYQFSCPVPNGELR